MSILYQDSVRFLNQINEDLLKNHELWQYLNQRLAIELSWILADQSNMPKGKRNPLNITAEKLGQAVGLNGYNNRLGLVFKDSEQQYQFVQDFEQKMDRYYKDKVFSLFATGTSFQGLSTNPTKYRKLGYMKMFGDELKTDLDLEIYSPDMVDKARKYNIALFEENFLIHVDKNNQKYARLSTFKNYTWQGDNQSPGLNEIEEWIYELEEKWNPILRENIEEFSNSQDYEVEFERITIGLINSYIFPNQKQKLGSPYELVRRVY